MANGEEEHVIMQLEHDRKIFLPVKVSWLFNVEDLRESLKSSKKNQTPTYFFYHNVATTEPIFSESLYTKEFDAEKPALYKGYISNKLYG